MSYRIVINPGYEDYRGQIEALIKRGRPAGAEVIYEGRNTLYRFKALPDRVAANAATSSRTADGNAIGTAEDTAIGAADRNAIGTADGTASGEADGTASGAAEGAAASDAGVSMVVKEFRKPNIVNAYAYTTVRTSKARRSYENARRMLELGFQTPEPIAYCEERKGLKLVASCYVSRELSGAAEMRHWEDHPDSVALVRAFAEEIKRLHEAGVWHKDFSPGNVLYTGDAQLGYTFHYVDLNRMKFGEHRREKLMSMFRSINLKPDETKRLARYYAEATGQEPEAVEREALSYLDGYFRERERKATVKKMLKKA